MIAEWLIGKDAQESGRGIIWDTIQHLPGELRISPGRDLNMGPPEYEAGVSTTRPRRSV
jgi:hypothetical protein